MEVNRRPSEVLEKQEIEQAIQSLHTQAEALRNELEIRAVIDLLRFGLRAKYLAIQRGDTCLLEKAETFCEFVLRCTTLLEAFRVSPTRRVRGPRGIAEQLGVANVTVYARIKALGITPRDITRAGDIGIKEFAEKEPLKSHIRELKEAMDAYKKADGGPHETEGHTESV